MRFLARAITFVAVLLLWVVPVSAQLGGINVQVFVSGFTGGANGAVAISGGPVASCPVTITVTGIIGMGAPLSSTYTLPKYQWIRFISSDGPAAQPQQTVVPKLGMEVVQDTFTLGTSGTYGDALVVTWPPGDGPPGNSLTNNATFTLTCPTIVNGKVTKPGSLTIPTPSPMVVATQPPPTPTPGGTITTPPLSANAPGGTITTLPLSANAPGGTITTLPLSANGPKPSQ